MKNKIINRILKKTGIPELVDILSSKLSPTDLQSLMLEAYAQRAGKLNPAQLLRHYRENRFVRPAAIKPEAMLEFDRLAISLLPPKFEPLALSPVSPLGSCSVVATVSQNNAVSTSRNTEVCSDSTNSLTLECALRRQAIYQSRNYPSEDTHLAASHRLLRPRFFDDPAFFPHFGIFSLCSAGRDRGNLRFEIESLMAHIDFYLSLIKAAAQQGYSFDHITAKVTAFDEKQRDRVDAEVVQPLAANHPEVGFVLDQQREEGRGYYSTAGFRIFIRNEIHDYMIVDGGFTDWMNQLLSNRKERLLISGMGSERFIFCFGSAAASKRDNP